MLKEKLMLNNIGVQVVIAMILGTFIGAMMGESASMFAPLYYLHQSNQDVGDPFGSGCSNLRCGRSR